MADGQYIVFMNLKNWPLFFLMYFSVFITAPNRVPSLPSEGADSGPNTDDCDSKSSFKMLCLYLLGQKCLHLTF